MFVFSFPESLELRNGIIKHPLAWSNRIITGFRNTFSCDDVERIVDCDKIAYRKYPLSMRYISSQTFTRWAVALTAVVAANMACSQSEYAERRTPDITPPASAQMVIVSPVLPQTVRNDKTAGTIFGLTEIKKQEYYTRLPEIKSNWISGQPVVVWQKIEKVAGQYDWKELDEQVVALQQAGLECTFVLLPVVVDADQYVRIKQRIGEKDIIDYLRLKESAEMKLYPHEPENFRRWRNFINALVERYDADGQNDASDLRYPVLNWRVMDEFPSIWFTDVNVYVQLLQTTYAEIHAGLPHARIITAGLESDLGRKFAFGEGFIDDDEAGIAEGALLSRTQVYDNRQYQKQKADYEYILKEGVGFYDVIDMHIYEPKSTFIAGKLAWLKNELSEMGIDAQIWSMEGGGPYKLRGGQKSIFGDMYFGNYSDKENAEYIAKSMLHTIAGGVKRAAYPLVENEGTEYYNGPFTNMGMLRPNGTRKPSYFTFIIVDEFLRGYSNLIDLSSGDMRLFEFNIGGKLRYIAWLDAPPKKETTNMIKLLPGNQVRIQSIVVALNDMELPIIPEAVIVDAFAVPMSETPLLIDESLE